MRLPALHFAVGAARTLVSANLFIPGRGPGLMPTDDESPTTTPETFNGDDVAGKPPTIEVGTNKKQHGNDPSAMQIQFAVCKEPEKEDIPVDFKSVPSPEHGFPVAGPLDYAAAEYNATLLESQEAMDLQFDKDGANKWSSDHTMQLLEIKEVKVGSNSTTGEQQLHQLHTSLRGMTWNIMMKPGRMVIPDRTDENKKMAITFSPWSNFQQTDDIEKNQFELAEHYKMRKIYQVKKIVQVMKEENLQFAMLQEVDFLLTVQDRHRKNKLTMIRKQIFAFWRNYIEESGLRFVTTDPKIPNVQKLMIVYDPKWLVPEKRRFGPKNYVANYYDREIANFGSDSHLHPLWGPYSTTETKHEKDRAAGMQFSIRDGAGGMTEAKVHLVNLHLHQDDPKYFNLLPSYAGTMYRLQKMNLKHGIATILAGDTNHCVKCAMPLMTGTGDLASGLGGSDIHARELGKDKTGVPIVAADAVSLDRRVHTVPYNGMPPPHFHTVPNQIDGFFVSPSSKNHFVAVRELRSVEWITHCKYPWMLSGRLQELVMLSLDSEKSVLHEQQEESSLCYAERAFLTRNREEDALNKSVMLDHASQRTSWAVHNVHDKEPRILPDQDRYLKSIWIVRKQPPGEERKFPALAQNTRKEQDCYSVSTKGQPYIRKGVEEELLKCLAAAERNRISIKQEPKGEQEKFLEDRDAWHWYYDDRKKKWAWTWNHEVWEKMLSDVVKGTPAFKPGTRIEGGLSALQTRKDWSGPPKPFPASEADCFKIDGPYGRVGEYKNLEHLMLTKPAAREDDSDEVPTTVTRAKKIDFGLLRGVNRFSMVQPGMGDD
ncbi:unnamed protein product [Amoebophrya sp. A120]|nr:unnamed protein product [Amoebophrya sp. A120]|eukprot:GSA120T00023105001.1